MNNEYLGKLIDSDQQRDAIHIAIAPVTASEMLHPGDHVGFVDGTCEGVAETETPIGIVDPFLRKRILPGQRFWMLLYPNTITSLRHEWTHPAITRSFGGDREAVEWLKHYAEEIHATYEEMMKATEAYLKHGEYWNEGDRFEGTYLPDEFWSHYQAATGTIVGDNERLSFFSCSC